MGELRSHYSQQNHSKLYSYLVFCALPDAMTDEF
jgi:hypothetical protein